MIAGEDKTRASNFFTQSEALVEIAALGWAVKSLASLTDPGSSEREIMENATEGISARLKYLYDSVRRLP